MRPMTNDVNVLKGMIRMFRGRITPEQESGLVRTLRLAKKFRRQNKKKRLNQGEQ